MGINAAGTARLDIFAGINLGSSNNTVGGTTPGARNVIGGGNQAGITIQTAGAFGISGNVVQGNYVGTDATGTLKLGFDQYGIVMANSTSNNLIGGTAAGAGNLVSGNGWGIAIEGFSSGSAGPPTGNVIQGNLVGVAVDGTTPLPNRVQGIRLDTAVNTIIGGTAPGVGNIVAFNGPTQQVGIGNGLEMLGGSGNSIRRNFFFGNGRLGIDLSPSGANANDPGDADTGANNRQNFPVIAAIVANGGQTIITGTLDSTPNTTFDIDFYSNATCDASGNGEGAKPFGSPVSVVTNANGSGTFNVVVPLALPTGRTITATATDPAGNTSEFSACDSSQTSGGVHFNPSGYTVFEDIGTFALTVVRQNGIGSVSVNYATIDGTAKAGEDYVAGSGTITFAPGETSKTINVQIINNDAFEDAEAFSVRLSNPIEPDVIDTPASATIELNDSSGVPLITISNASATEGNNGTTNAVFAVGISAPTGRFVTVDYFTSNMTAQGGVDFQAVSGTVTFQPGETLQTITVPVIGDVLDEFDETFRVRLTNPQNGLIANSGLGTIVDDDPFPNLSISDVTMIEGNSGTRTAVFTVNLSTVGGRNVFVNYATADGTATAGADYVAASGLLTFAPGEVEQKISVTVNGDAQAENDETIIVNLVSPVAAAVQRASATGLILDDDGTTAPLQLLLEESGPDPIQAAALDAILTVRDPFPVVNADNLLNQGPDKNTRVLLFAKDLQFAAGQPPSSVVIRFTNSLNAHIDVPAEDVRALLDLMQVSFRLPDGLAPGRYLIEIRTNGQSSNSGSLRIKS